MLANFDGNEKRQVCVSFVTRRLFGISRRVVVLDESGKERGRRDMAEAVRSGLEAFDATVTGVMSCWCWMAICRRAAREWDRELKDFWTWPSVGQGQQAIVDMDEIQMQIGRARMIDRVIPPSGGRPGEVILATWRFRLRRDGHCGRGRLAAVGFSGFDGRCICAKLLDAGDPVRTSLLIGNGLGATVCARAWPRMLMV